MTTSAMLAATAMNRRGVMFPSLGKSILSRHTGVTGEQGGPLADAAF
jgi:hypothetical protein